jgi:hypothetical protein
MPLFYFVAGPSVSSDPPKATDVLASTPVSPVSGNKAISQIFLFLYLFFDYGRLSDMLVLLQMSRWGI